MEIPAIREGETNAAERSPVEVNSAFSEDGVDLTLIHWFLDLSPYERLLAAQDMIDAVWMLREAK